MIIILLNGLSKVTQYIENKKIFCRIQPEKPAGGRGVRGCAPVETGAVRHKKGRAIAQPFLCLGREH